MHRSNVTNWGSVMRTNGLAVKERAQGFTLIELMVTVAIVAILAAIVYPSYQRYIVRNNRAAAQSALMDVAQRQQQFLLDNRAYACDDCSLYNLAAGCVSPLPANVMQNYQRVAISLAAGTCALPPTPPAFTATLTPLAGTRQAADGPLSIDQAGTKTPANNW
jgi:type IV pilus assembly protein PilE